MSMNGNPKGVANKNKDSDVYAFAQYIVSKDGDSAEMRCGRLDAYVQESSGEWYGMTVAQVFKKSWKPNDGFDPNERVVGKKCFMGIWQGSERADITSDNSIIVPGDEIGTVVAEVGMMVKVRMNQSFTTTPAFMEEGKWCQVADPSALQPGDKCYIERPITRPSPQRTPSQQRPPQQTEVLQNVIERYPNADLQQFVNLIRTHAPAMLPNIPTTRPELVKYRMSCRYQNPICENPQCAVAKSAVESYVVCQCCKIVLYCSTTCQDAHATLHRSWAAQLPHSPPPEYNPQAPLLINFADDGKSVRAAYSYNSKGEMFRKV